MDESVTTHVGNVSYEEIGIRGKYRKIKILKVDDFSLLIRGSLLKRAHLKDEDFQDLLDPAKLIEKLERLRDKPDIFTFIQRYPDIDLKYEYHSEFEDIAVLHVQSYKDWEGKISKNTQRMIQKGGKSGIQVRLTSFNDEFVSGMIKIFNETPFRQGKKFWHFGKDFEIVKREFSRFLFREEIIGAYHENNLAGFIFLAKAGRYAIPTQILSKISYQKMGITAMLMAKAVEVCVDKKIPYIIYGDWQDTGLTEFKRRSGFERAATPRYYVPLTLRGKLALRLGFHRGLLKALPSIARQTLLRMRASYANWMK